MGWKTKYYEVFGLTETATKSDVKRQYRKLAMKFHPDRNPDPKAHKLFLDLTEAYQILMDNRVVGTTQRVRETTNTKSAAEQREERYKQGQERYRQYLKNKQLAYARAYQNFISGTRWRIFKISAIISFVIGSLLLVDYVLPTRSENHMIVSASIDTYSGLQNDNIREVITDKDLTMYLSDFYMIESIRSWPLVEVKRSFIFRNPVLVNHNHEITTSYHVDFSIVNLFPFLSILLFIPGITYRFKKRSNKFYMFYFISQYPICLIVAYVILSQQRWLHLLTLGFV